jgi:hypothetical protein
VGDQAEFTFTRLLFVWLEQVEGDSELPASAFKVAFRVGQRFDRDTLACFPGLQHIADKTKLRKETVSDGIARLAARGHLAVTPGSKGRGHSNRYEMIIKGPKTGPLDTDRKGPVFRPLEATEKVRFSGEKVRFSVVKGPKTGLDPLTIHLDPPRESAPSARGSLSQSLNSESKTEKPNRKSRAIQLPRGWKPADEDLAYGVSLGLTATESELEAEEYRLTPPNMRRITFRLWLHRAIEYQQRHPNEYQRPLSRTSRRRMTTSGASG